ncbi:MAG: hypothetical protein KBG60_04360, partial [Anaerolineaceae bacterium]|nr:hypothetical protein [Anaerolineaceae bacterium]
LAAARSRYGNRRIVVVWQPHTYSRTIALLDAFSSAFQAASEVYVTEIYAARESNPQITGEQLAEKINHPEVQFLPSLVKAHDLLLQKLRPGDVLLVLSAGDADQISRNVISGLQKLEVNHE